MPLVRGFLDKVVAPGPKKKDTNLAAGERTFICSCTLFFYSTATLDILMEKKNGNCRIPFIPDTDCYRTY